MSTPAAERDSRVVQVDGERLDLACAHIAHLDHVRELGSTMDRAHALAMAGAPSGTVVVADVQTAGRGRAGKSWVSRGGQGLWCTIVERAPDEAALAVLSLRIGLALAEVLQPWCEDRVMLKWPNDVLLASGDKLAGVLVEARWREGVAEWVAIGIGLNLRARDAGHDAARHASHDAHEAPHAPLDRDRNGDSMHVRAATPSRAVSRASVLEVLIPRVRRAVHADGVLSHAEQLAWASRDAMRGKGCVEPAPGIVEGIDADGSLRVRRADGLITSHRSGSLILASGPASGATPEDGSC